MKDRLSIAWLALCRELERHSLDLLEEVRLYPTPLARCDVQLTQLLEERDEAFARVRRANELQRESSGLSRAAWRARLLDFVPSLATAHDPALAHACRQLVDALEG